MDVQGLEELFADSMRRLGFRTLTPMVMVGAGSFLTLRRAGRSEEEAGYYQLTQPRLPHVAPALNVQH